MRSALWVGIICATISVAHAKMHKCADPQGRVTFQETPCTAVEIDKQVRQVTSNTPASAKEREDWRRQHDAERAEQLRVSEAMDQATRENARRDFEAKAFLAGCVKGMRCKKEDLHYAISRAQGWKSNSNQSLQDFYRSVLGKPSSTQLFGGSQNWYYRFKTDQGVSQFQLVFEDGKVRINAY
jgi:hypothetical protein